MSYLCNCGNAATRIKGGNPCCIQCDGLNRIPKSRVFDMNISIEIHEKVISVGDEVCYKNGNCRGIVLHVDDGVAWVKSHAGAYMTANTSKLVSAVSVDLDRIDELNDRIAKAFCISSDMLSVDIKSR